jgi:hypothetical protein
MRPAPHLHIEWVEDEAVVLDPDTGDVHHLNPTAAFAYALIIEHGFDEGMRKLTESTDDAEQTARFGTMVEEFTAKGLVIDD